MTSGNRFANSWLARVPVPFPRNYVMGIDLQKWDLERKMLSYLRGEWKVGGWWYYYLYAMAIKVPLGTWLLVVLSVIDCLRRSPSRDELFVLVPLFAVLILVSSQTGFSHHLRYVLPIFPFAFVWISRLARDTRVVGSPMKYLRATGVVWSVASSLWIYPHSLSYFNELVGEPKHGHEHLGGIPHDTTSIAGRTCYTCAGGSQDTRKRARSISLSTVRMGLCEFNRIPQAGPRR